MENTFEWSIIDRWNVHQGFVNAVAERISEGLEKFPVDVRKDVKIIFSAHSIPMAVVYRYCLTSCRGNQVEVMPILRRSRLQCMK